MQPESCKGKRGTGTREQKREENDASEPKRGSQCKNVLLGAYQHPQSYGSNQADWEEKTATGTANTPLAQQRGNMVLCNCLRTELFLCCSCCHRSNALLATCGLVAQRFIEHMYIAYVASFRTKGRRHTACGKCVADAETSFMRAQLPVALLAGNRQHVWHCHGKFLCSGGEEGTVAYTRGPAKCRRARLWQKCA